MFGWIVLASAAFAHGGEYHSVPPPAGADAGARAATWSSEFEAVLVPGHPDVLWVANFQTSAPEPAGSARITIPGAGEVTAASSDVPGRWPLAVPLPGAGPADLMILTPTRSDALGLPTWEMPHDVAAEVDVSGGPSPLWVVAGLIGLGVGLGAGVGLGRSTGRRAAVALACMALAGAGARGWAHGGEDHGGVEAPAAASATGALVLPLDSQFLLDLRTALVRSGPFAPSLRASGTTVAPPDGAVDLAAPTSGAVSYPRALRPGDGVAAGDALAVVTEALGAADRVAGAEARAAAGARLAEARRAVALAERDAAKAAGLKDVISDREDLARAEGVVAARAQLRVAEAAWAAIPGATSTLRAPFAGRVSSIFARAGETVTVAAPVVRVTGEGGLWVNAAVPERWAGQLRSGAEVRLVSAAGGVPVDARVLDPGLEADPATGMLHVVVALDAPVPGLVPGMSVTATIGVGDAREALVVPDSAVVDSDGQTLVFIKTAPERFVLRPVRVGARSGDLREVLAGVEPGERVVVQSTYALRSLAGR